jgi:hypothetical protein
MHHILQQLIDGVVLTGDVLTDVRILLMKCGHLHTLEHCMRVSREAYQLARRFSVNADGAIFAVTKGHSNVGLKGGQKTVSPMGKACFGVRK